MFVLYADGSSERERWASKEEGWFLISTGLFSLRVAEGNNNSSASACCCCSNQPTTTTPLEEEEEEGEEGEGALAFILFIRLIRVSNVRQKGGTEDEGA